MTFQKLCLNGENMGEANLELVTEDATQNVPKALQVQLFTPLAFSWLPQCGSSVGGGESRKGRLASCLLKIVKTIRE